MIDPAIRGIIQSCLAAMSRAAVASLVVLSSLSLSNTVEAQQRSTFKLRGHGFLTAFQPVVDQTHYSVVRFERFDKHRDVWVDASLGAVVDPSGLVLTKASELYGTLRASGATYRHLDATVVAQDARHDLAVVQIDEPHRFADKPLQPIEWADVAGEVGRWVITPDTDRMPAAVGVLSVTERTIPRSDSPGVLGITMDLEVSGWPTIKSVNRDSAADRAGVLVGDEIREVNRVTVSTREQLVRTVQRMSPGDRVSLRVFRNGEVLDLFATLQHIPPITDEEDNPWNSDVYRTRWAIMNELGSTLSVRRDNFPSAVQHDTVLEPTDCGGPALNLNGQAIGINIARSGRTESLMISARVAREAVKKMLATLPSRPVRTQWTATQK